MDKVNEIHIGKDVDELDGFQVNLLHIPCGCGKAEWMEVTRYSRG